MSLKKRFKPKRRNVSAKSMHDCVNCAFYTPIDGSPCLWKLEAQIDASTQHHIQALKLIRKLTAVKQKKLRHFMEVENHD